MTGIDQYLYSFLGCSFLLLVCIALLPPLTIGIIRKTKARMQNRVGASIVQPFFDLIKLYHKEETVSKTASWIFRSTAATNTAIILIMATLIPWLSFKPSFCCSDFILVVYLFALARFFTILAALDTGSPFGAFGASRESTLSLLVEPSVVLALASMSVLSKTTDLNVIFSSQNVHLINSPGSWILVGLAIYLASLVELSRMPVDDPTTHLELTMVHEAMILEASGKNLALIEYAHSLRMAILFGLSWQCFMHAFPAIWHGNDLYMAIISIAGIFIMSIVTAIFESLAVKLQWLKVPEFIAYSLTMSLLSILIAIGGSQFNGISFLPGGIWH